MLVRSIPIKIKVNEVIVKTIELYKQGLQHCVDVAWGMKIRNNVQLHPFVYSELRKTLPSQLSIACIKQACGIVKKARSNPNIFKVSIRYNTPRSFSFKNNILSISTIQGRIKIPIKIPDYALKYFENWDIRESLLTQSKEKYYFTFTFAQESPLGTSNQHNKVLGIDLGVNNLAVTSENKVYGGKYIKFLRNKRDRFVADLQRKGTKASRRKLKKFSGKWTRFMRITNHKISKSIVDGLQEGDVVVMEDLSDIRRTAKYNKWVHKWAFRQLKSFIEYKSLAIGCRVVYVNPKYTSKECNRCHTRNTIRNSGFFKCNSCGHSLNSDINGARNIAGRYILSSRASITKPIILGDDTILRG